MIGGVGMASGMTGEIGAAGAGSKGRWVWSALAFSGPALYYAGAGLFWSGVDVLVCVLE